jgi:hypothetical protein
MTVKGGGSTPEPYCMLHESCNTTSRWPGVNSSVIWKRTNFTPPSPPAPPAPPPVPSAMPKHMATVVDGHFEVDNQPFFPCGFYYLWNSKYSFTMPPRTDFPRSNASQWSSADAFWRHYHATGFNTFVVGWLGITRDHGVPPFGVGGHGYGTMLDYLDGLGLDDATAGDPGILPILNVMNTQELVNSKSLGQRIDAAGKMGNNYRSDSFLGYYVYDEPVPPLIEADRLITNAVAGNDTRHLTWSNVVGVMNGGARRHRRRRLDGFNYGDMLAARNLAAQHPVVMTDSFTEYQTNLSSASRINPNWVVQDVERLRSISQPGQPNMLAAQVRTPRHTHTPPGHHLLA